MLATDPMMVRLPAKVVANASTFHISVGSTKRVIHFPATRTNGTLEKMFDPHHGEPGQVPSLRDHMRSKHRLKMAINRIRETGIAESIDDHKQGRKKYQQMPVN